MDNRTKINLPFVRNIFISIFCPSLSCIIVFNYIHFQHAKSLPTLVFSRSFSVPYALLSMLGGLSGTGTEKLLKTQVMKILPSEMKYIILYSYFIEI